MPRYYPAFLNISGKKCVVVGGGRVALRKVKVLLEHGADVTVVSPTLCQQLDEMAKASKVTALLKEYEPGDIKDSFLVIAATPDTNTNKKIADEAKRKRILVSVVDNIKHSDFIGPSYFRKGDLTIAISTGGSTPALARKIRARLEDDLTEEYAYLVDLIKEVRSELRKGKIIVSSDYWQKALDLDLLLELLRTGKRDKAKATLLANLSQTTKHKVS